MPTSPACQRGVGAEGVDAVGLRFGAPARRQRVGDAAPVRSYAQHVAVAKTVLGIILADAAEFERVLGQVRAQQRASPSSALRLVDTCSRPRASVTTTCSCARAGQHRQVVDRERAGRDRTRSRIGWPFRNTSTVDGTTASPRAASSGVGDQHRLGTEVGAVLHAAEPHGSAPGTQRRDRVAHAQGRHAVREVAGPGACRGASPGCARRVRRWRPACRSARPGCRRAPSSRKPPPSRWLPVCVCREIVVDECARCRSAWHAGHPPRSLAREVGTKACAGRVTRAFMVAASRSTTAPISHRAGSSAHR